MQVERKKEKTKKEKTEQKERMKETKERRKERKEENRKKEMRIELILIVVAGFVIANIYTDGKYWKLLLSWKKYYQMAGVAFGAFVLYWLIKKNPKKANDMIATSNEYLKYLPMDSGTTPSPPFGRMALGAVVGRWVVWSLRSCIYTYIYIHRHACLCMFVPAQQNNMCIYI